MARLILSLDSQVLAEFNMSKERYTIGRLPDNDVRIDNPAVSGHHSLIINILNDSFLEDLNSTNGTYVNGKLVKKHALQHDDVVTIGHHQLRFADEQTNQTEQDEFEKTMVIPTNQQDAAQLEQAERAADIAAAAEAAAAESIDVRVEMPKSEPESEPVAKPVPAPEHKPESEPATHAQTSVGIDPSTAPTAPPATHAQTSVGIDPSTAPTAPPATHAQTTVGIDPSAAPTAPPATHAQTSVGVDPSTAPTALPMAKLQVLSGAFAGRDLKLTKALTTLGRPGVQVAAITRRAEGYFVVHVESGEEGDYPLVNGQPIGAQARKLTDNDILQLAGVKMGFFAS